jgi:dihydroorotate dehydrogenase
LDVSGFYRHCLRPILFQQKAESAHNLALKISSIAGHNRLLSSIVGSIYGAPALPVNVFGLEFPNPVGLAAGLDKHAAAVPVWEKLGFGFCELGGVTWEAQPGNPQPRMFRAVADEAIINRMGFNNSGAEAMAAKLSTWKKSGRWPRHPVGINLGKSKNTPLEKAAEDYANSFRALRNFADFFVVNVSSPNTPNLRQLQDKTALNEILAAIQEANAKKLPLLIKIAPDLSFWAIDEILELVTKRHLAGIVATNTTITRPPTKDPQSQEVYAETGGLSGKPLRARSTEIIRHIYQQTGDRVKIIGVGGIFNADDAWEKIAAGASLVQVYTGLVYEGPSLAQTIVAGLAQKLAAAGMKHLSEAVGSATRSTTGPVKAD